MLLLESRYNRIPNPLVDKIQDSIVQESIRRYGFLSEYIKRIVIKETESDYLQDIYYWEDKEKTKLRLSEGKTTRYKPSNNLGWFTSNHKKLVVIPRQYTQQEFIEEDDTELKINLKYIYKNITKVKLNDLTSFTIKVRTKNRVSFEYIDERDIDEDDKKMIYNLYNTGKIKIMIPESDIVDVIIY